MSSAVLRYNETFHAGSTSDAASVTPSDTADLPAPARSIYVGVTGDVTLVTMLGTTVTFKSVPAGAILPIQTARVLAAGTTATFLVAFV